MAQKPEDCGERFLGGPDLVQSRLPAALEFRGNEPIVGINLAELRRLYARVNVEARALRFSTARLSVPVHLCHSKRGFVAGRTHRGAVIR